MSRYRAVAASGTVVETTASSDAAALDWAAGLTVPVRKVQRADGGTWVNVYRYRFRVTTSILVDEPPPTADA